MEFNEVFGPYVANSNYHVRRGESEKYEIFDYLVTVIALYFVWLFYQLNWHRLLTSIKCLLCNHIAAIWKGTQSWYFCHYFQTEDDFAESEWNGILPSPAAVVSNKKVKALAADIKVSMSMQKKLMLENMILRNQLLTSEMKLCASVKQVIELQQKVRYAESIGQISRDYSDLDTQLSTSVSLRSVSIQRRTTYFDRLDNKDLKTWSKGVNSDSTKIESQPPLEENKSESVKDSHSPDETST